MNLTTPPFDDIHVRKAMNLVMDLEGIQRAWGGPVQGSIPTHILPQSMIDLTDYEPYQKAPYAGDVEAAKAEMAQSKYDTDKDGICDAPECKGVLHINRNFAPWSNQSAIITQSAAKIGVDLETREASRSAVQAATGTPGRKLPTSSGTGWGKDYADPSTFMVLYDGRNILAEGNSAQALTGITAAKAKEVGAVIPATGPPPSVDADIDACALLINQAADRLLDRPGQEADGAGRAADRADRCEQHRPARPVGDEVRLRPVRHRDGPRARRGGPLPAELRKDEPTGEPEPGWRHPGSAPPPDPSWAATSSDD